MNKVFLYISTIRKLGLPNVIYIIWYKAGMKFGFRKYWFGQEKPAFNEPFFTKTVSRNDYPSEWKADLIEDANKIVKGKIRYYAYHWKQLGNPPNWFLNPFNGKEYPNISKHWTKLEDFNPIAGDIKNIWEASRFEWVVTLARAYAVTGDVVYLNTLNSWLADWTEKNPLNTGPNWKCGQEASIRLFNLLNASFILNQYDTPSDSLKKLVYSTLGRINGNLFYAIAQDNNHGTSEAAALVIGGEWLKSLDEERYKKAAGYAQRGRYWLENRVNKLIAPKGAFSQHSITYHRVMLDTFCFAEVWRNKLEAKPFSHQFYDKAKAATNWLFQLTDELSGNAPNLGANDGALLLNMHSCSYRNFRPTLQLAGKLFFNTNWFRKDKHDEPLFWFGMNNSGPTNVPVKADFSAEGYATLHKENTWALIKWPFYKFRPSQNDALHIDIWHKGKNIICDSGSYSYNPDNNFGSDLNSVHFHNTVSFDNQEQMPQLSRFLLGNWLKAETALLESSENLNASKWTGSYKDACGNRHKRTIEIHGNKWLIKDMLSGNFNKAVIGYNLNTGECKLKNGYALTPFFNMELPGKTTVQLKDTIISEHYQEKHDLKRIEIEVNQPGIYITSILLNDL